MWTQRAAREPTKPVKRTHKTNYIIKKHTSLHIYPFNRGVDLARRDEKQGILTNERAETTLPVIAFDLCFMSTASVEPGTSGDAGATCLVIVDVCTGCDLWGRKINFTNSKTLVGVATDRYARYL